MKGSIDEVVARALFEANPTRNKALQWEHAAVPKGRYRKQATATLAALSEAGYVIVPREPTEKMVGDGAGAAAFADGFIAPSIIAEPERVLQKALDAGLTGAVVLGYAAEGDYYFASSYADGGEVLWLTEWAKTALFRTGSPTPP